MLTTYMLPVLCRAKCRTHRAGAAVAMASCAQGEALSGMEAEAQLLEEFTCVPILNKATLRPLPGGGVQTMVGTHTKHVANLL